VGWAAEHRVPILHLPTRAHRWVLCSERAFDPTVCGVGIRLLTMIDIQFYFYGLLWAHSRGYGVFAGLHIPWKV